MKQSFLSREIRIQSKRKRPIINLDFFRKFDLFCIILKDNLIKKEFKYLQKL